MTLYVKTDYVPDGYEYIVAGKEYEATRYTRYTGYSENLYCIKTEVEYIKSIIIRIDQCAHLNGKPWTVINR